VRLTLEQAGDANLVRGWEGGALRVNDRLVPGTVLVSADHLSVVAVDDVAAIDEGSLAAAVDLQPEVLLVGTGSRQQFLPARIVASMAAAGIGMEVMDTRAAARTYNVLVGEGRRVVALLLPPDQ
jgi:uncharacterized protein